MKRVKHYARWIQYVVSYGSKWQREDGMERERFDCLADAFSAKERLLKQGYTSVKIYRMEEVESCVEVG